ncbi:QueT transporter family protein [Oceanobacillus caeni]|uniref:Membrane protein n=1 Tax=Oceanobacillus caeni TaxID=405946 RepID=A0ABR5MJQ2_9BACI|nr:MULTISPECIES: QueT transporter family protein [Bacillaceae]KKE79913.1 membrane protein [Bacilli bacterium VT-13-104]PZD84092.1 QueT transporter family protein [Bacilli bacterium]KPH75208.1 membrane protein [Oceanobacillus caeni]MBU8792295.1 QueT transporter family protein [Oceanobacillus caeni]MCR1835726.1 QueT transporter family protein [Oceanobacillus caeni]
MNIKTLTANGVLAAMYIAVSALIQPFGFTNVQFRVPEMFNHLVVFNKKFFFGIIFGVFLTNLFFSPMRLYDIVFGVAHSAISLGLIILLSKYTKNTLLLLAANAIIFSFNMFIVALELYLALGLPFLFSWVTTAIGEIVVLAIGIPIMYTLNKQVHFDKII